MKMRRCFSITTLLVMACFATSGCGSPGQQHTIRPPDPPGSYQTPRTKAEKIAAINRASVSDEMKKTEIAKVNAGP
jgi:hypothetical protein